MLEDSFLLPSVSSLSWAGRITHLGRWARIENEASVKEVSAFDAERRGGERGLGRRAMGTRGGRMGHFSICGQGVQVHNTKTIFGLRRNAFVNVTSVDQVSFYPISSVNY